MLPLLALLTTLAAAGGLQPRTSREPLPSRILERPLVLPKGWTALALTGERGIGPAEGAEAGEVARTTGIAHLRHGLAPGHEVSLWLPWHGVRGEAQGPGDVIFGWRASLLRREPPNTSVALEVGLQAPLGRSMGVMPLGTGTHAVTVGLAGRRQVGALLLTARGTAVARLPGWTLLDGQRVSLDPGDRGVASLSAQVQLAPLVLGVEPAVAAWTADRVAGGAGPVDAGVGADLRLRGTLQLTRAVDLTVGRAVPMVGPGVPEPVGAPLYLSTGPRWFLTFTGRM